MSRNDDLDGVQQRIDERQALLNRLHDRIDEDDDLTPGERDVLRTRASGVAGQLRTLRGAP